MRQYGYHSRVFVEVQAKVHYLVRLTLLRQAVILLWYVSRIKRSLLKSLEVTNSKESGKVVLFQRLILTKRSTDCPEHPPLYARHHNANGALLKH